MLWVYVVGYLAVGIISFTLFYYFGGDRGMPDGDIGIFLIPGWPIYLALLPLAVSLVLLSELSEWAKRKGREAGF